MSRIGNKPITIPDNVEVRIEGDKVIIKGPKGELEEKILPGMKVEVSEGLIKVINTQPEDKQHRAWHGLLRSLLANMVKGVTQGWKKELELVGVGYRAKMEGRKVVLSVGYSHNVEVEVPEDLEVKVDKNTQITVEGIDKYKVGQLAANIRAVRPPEPYKGKGIRYKGEVVRRKAGKAGKAAA